MTIRSRCISNTILYEHLVYQQYSRYTKFFFLRINWYLRSGTYFYTIKALCTKTQNVRDFINFAFWSRKESEEEEEDDDDDEEEEENPIALPFFSPKNDHRSF